MDFREDLARVASDPEMLRHAIRRAGNRELAEDALQEAARAIAERRSSQIIENLRGFFYVALIHEIDHQLGRQAAFPAADIVVLCDRGQDRTSFSTALPLRRSMRRPRCACSPKQSWNGSSVSTPARC